MEVEYEGDLMLFRQLGKMRIGAMVLPGFIRGVYGSAQLGACEAAGYTQHLRVLVGISTGACAALYAAGGVLERGTAVYYTEAATRRFMAASVPRLVAGTGAHMGYICDVFRGREGNNPADLAEARLRSDQDFYVGATDYTTGKGVLLDAKALPDMVDAVHASIAVPILYRMPALVNGRRYVDGGIAIPFPAQEVVERWDLNGLIVFANRPKSVKPGLAWRVAEYTYGSLLSVPLRRALRTRDQQYAEGLEYLRTRCKRDGFPYLILWSGERVWPLSRDGALIQAEATDMYTATKRLIESAGV